jgi:hypothetical protein
MTERQVFRIALARGIMQTCDQRRLSVHSGMTSGTPINPMPSAGSWPTTSSSRQAARKSLARQRRELGQRVPRPRQRPARRHHRDIPERGRHPRHLSLGADRQQQRHPRHRTQRQADCDDRHRGLDRGRRRKATARLGRAGFVRALPPATHDVAPPPSLTFPPSGR